MGQAYVGELWSFGPAELILRVTGLPDAHHKFSKRRRAFCVFAQPSRVSEFML
jgi:hypothetical protein